VLYESTDPLSMNLGFEEQYPKREWFVVERFSAVVVPLRNILKSALKRSTTNLPRPLTFVLSPAVGERKCGSRTNGMGCDLLSRKGIG
jgi:hypothetical protein